MFANLQKQANVAIDKNLHRTRSATPSKSEGKESLVKQKEQTGRRINKQKSTRAQTKKDREKEREG